MNFLQKHTLKISLIALILSVSTLVFNIYMINREEVSVFRPAVYKILLDNYDKPDGFLKDVEHPRRTTSGGVDKILSESLFHTEAIFVLENREQRYTYKLLVKGKYGLPLLLGFNTVNNVELVSIENL